MNINFDEYQLSTKNNVLICRPTKKGVPAVTVNLNEVVGVERYEGRSQLKFGKMNFSKECSDIRIEVIDGSNFLCANIHERAPNAGLITECKLMLDGNLSITIPANAQKAVDDGLCGIKLPWCDGAKGCSIM